MRTLSSLQIIPAPKPGSNMLQLAPSFKKNFRLALTGGGDHMSFGVPSEKDPAGGVTVEMLDRYAANCWEVSANSHQTSAFGKGSLDMIPLKCPVYIALHGIIWYRRPSLETN